MKKMMIATLAAASVLLAVANQAHAGATLDAVQKKGFVQCGISDGLPGFSYADADGKFSGIVNATMFDRYLPFSCPLNTFVTDAVRFAPFHHH